MNKPSKRFATVKTRGGVRYAAKTVIGITEKSEYRPDLKKEALARLTAVIESQKPSKALEQKKGRVNLKQQAAKKE